MDIVKFADLMIATAKVVGFLWVGLLLVIGVLYFMPDDKRVNRKKNK